MEDVFFDGDRLEVISGPRIDTSELDRLEHTKRFIMIYYDIL